MFLGRIAPDLYGHKAELLPREGARGHALPDQLLTLGFSKPAHLGLEAVLRAAFRNTQVHLHLGGPLGDGESKKSSPHAFSLPLLGPTL